MTTTRFDNLQAELIKYGELLVERYRSQLKIDGTSATNKTRDSIRYKSTKDELEILSDLSLKYVDEGRPAGAAPSLSAIEAWAKAKGIKPKDGSGKFVAVNDRSMFWMAKNIAKSISEKGTIKRFGYKGSGIIDFVYQNNKEAMLDDIFAAYGRDIEEVIKDIVKRK